ncbi:MAG TPA: response regulator [Flavisolibacter sp.]
MTQDKGYRILVIDDDLDLLMLMERRLLNHGYEVETAASLPEAEELIPAFQPDLVLLDIHVKSEDGRSLCWKLKQDRVTRFIKVFIISGYDTNKSRATLFGADELVPKPLDFEFLLHLIERYRNVYEADESGIPPPHVPRD